MQRIKQSITDYLKRKGITLEIQDTVSEIQDIVSEIQDTMCNNV